MSLSHPTPIDLLELSTDGRIPPEVSAAVRAAARPRQTVRPTPHHCRIRLRRWRGKAIAERIGEVIARRVRLGARCFTQADLRRDGFTSAEIAEQGEAGAARAAELLGQGPAGN